jgi:hypothetical protein
MIFFKLICISLIFLLAVNIKAQKRTEEEIKQAALIKFSGSDLTKKEGPLVKAGNELVLLSEEFKEYTATKTLTSFKASNSLLHIQDDKVVVDIISSGDPLTLESELKNLGMKVTGVAGPIVSGLLPINTIENVAALKEVNFFRPAMWTTQIGLTTSQGDESMLSDKVRTLTGYDGTGVTVGVLSDSYDYLGTASNDVTSGDLPGFSNPFGFTTPVNVLQDDGTSDEGRGMLQIVHDVAPGAALVFATANGGQANFTNNIDLLRTSAGADIIVDDVIYFAEPMFQDGIIAQSVDDAFKAGVPYFSSAGNNGQESYESVWRSGPTLAPGSIPISGGTFYGGTAFDFDPGPGVDYLQSFIIESGTTFIVLQWDSPFASVCTGCPGSSNDVDIYLLNSAGSLIYFGSVIDNIDGDAVEVFTITNSGAPRTVNLMIVKFSGPDPGFLKYVNFGPTMGSLEYATNSSTIYGHANANGAEAVAAAAYYNTPEFGVDPPLLEGFSSYGPTAIRFDTQGNPASDDRMYKPEITAPDGVNTTFFGSDIGNDADAYPNFFGTSAAAPHAAAVAALILQSDNTLTPSEIYSRLESTTIDMSTTGFDNGTGYGLIQANDAILLPLDLTAYLQGPYFENYIMNADLDSDIPTSDPYSLDESVSSLPSNDIVDWIKIELRSASSPSGATTIEAVRGAFLKYDGSIVDLDGTSPVRFYGISAGEYFVAVHHRNHLAILSENQVTLSFGSTAVYDFTTGSDKIYGGSMGVVLLETIGVDEVWGMIAGDGNSDGGIYAEDYTLYKTTQGDEGYIQSDYNLDGGAYAEDYTIYKLNQGKETLVP